MARPKLRPDDEIADVAPGLAKPTDYVRSVFGNMHAYKKEFGSAFVRIGVTGKGRSPHYRIEPAPDQYAFLSRIENLMNVNADAVAVYFRAFNGVNHKPLPWGIGELQGEHWSTAYSSYESVQLLLGALRSKLQ